MKRLFLVSLLLASGCDDYFKPTIDSFTVDDPNPPFATAVHLTYQVRDASVVSIIPDPGEVRSSPVTVLPRGHTVYTLRAENQIGSVTRDITVDPQPAPGPATVDRFVVLPAQAPAGTQRTISWNVTNGLGLTLRGGSIPLGLVKASGSLTDTPTATTEYTLAGSSGPGFQPASFVVNTVARVTPPVAITSFAANPSTILQGQTSTLSWDGNALGWFVQPGTGTKISVGPAKSLVVRPSQTTVYSLTGEGAGGVVGPQPVTVTVTPRPGTKFVYIEPTVTTEALEFTADNACTTGCATLTLHIRATGATSLRGIAVDLPADSSKISVASFATALDKGAAVLGTGPLKDTLVLGAAQAGTGSGPAPDVSFSAGAEIANLVLALPQPDGGQGLVFDGASQFKAYIQTASARTAGGVAIGKLEVQ